MSSVRYLAESENYKVTSEHEVVYLSFKNATRAPVMIGDFYGDPACAIISGDERFVAMAGCGLIIYFLNDPFEPYTYDTPTAQWKEYCRGPEPQNLWWCEALFQPGDVDGDWNFIRFVAGNFDRVYRLNVTSGQFNFIREDGEPVPITT